ncbi:MAG TPA: hypothetical protein VFF04_04430 [Candidatus Babeliales bacterium]|nr:hypothetical protein [Candidatus Babeliales bacterium]
MSYCLYYQAHIRQSHCWFFVAALRSFEHVAFDRTFNVDESVFEFFVPPTMEPFFLEFMEYFKQQGIVSELKQLKNRLEQ